MEISRIGQRAAILRGIREFFWARDFLEVETPVVLPYPSQEPYLEPLQTIVHDHRGKAYDGFLRMSPEFSLKKLIAAFCSPTPSPTSPSGLRGTSRSPSPWDGEKNRGKGASEEVEKKDNFPTPHREGGQGGVGDQRSGVNGQVSGVFEIGPVFRDGEPWGEAHNPEFTLLEWYRLGATYRDLMNDCEALVLHSMSVLGVSQRRGSSKSKAQSSKQIQNSNGQNNFSPSLGEGERLVPRSPEGEVGEGVGHSSLITHHSSLVLSYQGQTINLTPPWERLTMREAWKRYAKLDLDRLLASGKTSGVDRKTPDVEERARSVRTALARVCTERDYTVAKDDTFDDLFFKIHLTEVEPKLGRIKPTLLTDWPTQMAALARRKQKNPRYAERVELYIGGLELANGFSELTDADEQLRRFKADQRLRRKLGKTVYPIDQDFIAALHHLPPCAGMALGVDRLVMLLTDAASIEEVRWLPTSELFGRYSFRPS